MTPVVLGATGRLGRILRAYWGAEGAIWAGRETDAIRAAHPVVDLRGIRPGDGDVGSNLDLAEAALHRARQVGAGRVFLASSAAVYGRMAGALTEDRAAPVSAYGRTKLDIEGGARAQNHPVTCLRIGNVAGADAILGGHRPGFRLDVLDGGATPVRSYIGPKTFAQVVLGLLRVGGLPTVLNLAAPGPGVEMGALLDRAGMAWSARSAGPQVIPKVVLDTSLLERHLPVAQNSGTVETLVSEFQQYRSAVCCS